MNVRKNLITCLINSVKNTSPKNLNLKILLSQCLRILELMEHTHMKKVNTFLNSVIRFLLYVFPEYQLFPFIDAAVIEQRRIAATLGPCPKGGNHELRQH